jgi:putative acetyltransferase
VPLRIRPERPDDYDAIARVTAAAFERENEARLVELVRASENYVPELSLVAEEDGEIVGHTMLSYARLTGDEELDILVLAPVSVTPERQQQGIGSALVEAAIELADARGEPLINLLGHPNYYPRFGFESARALGIEPPDPRIADAAFMVRKLSSYHPRYRGRLVYPPALAEA